MALHVAAMMAFFMNQAQQAPVQIQCVSAVPEPTLKWLLPTIVQTVISLASITAGVVIAVWSFRKTKDLTEWSFRATSERDHERWVLDQKKAEWRDLLTTLDEVGKMWFPPYRQSDTIDMLIERTQNACGPLDGITAKYIFIGQSIGEMSIQFDKFVKTISDGSERLESLRFNKRAKIRILEEYNNLRGTFQSLVWFARNRANLDLGIWKIAKNSLIIPTDNRDNS